MAGGTVRLTGVPILERGWHPDPAAGGCFMEYASRLAGERWSDHPACTHPALAELARLVNDAASPAARRRLARLVPDVIGVQGTDPDLTPLLVLHCLAGLSAVRGDGSSPVQRARAGRRLARLAGGGAAARCCRLTDVLYRAGPARRVFARAAWRLGSGADADDRLVELLAGAVAIARRRLLPAAAPAGLAATAGDRSGTA